jgi:uncharacterized protein
MKRVFADSFYFFALLNPRDEAHSRCVEYSAERSPCMLTTAWVLTELADGFSQVKHRHLLPRIIERLDANRHHLVLPANEDLFNRGVGLYNSRTDKEWSLTDCISFIAMEDHGVTEALTADKHFEQAGFVALLAE